MYLLNEKIDPKEIREAMGLSREKFSQILKISSKTVNRWETGVSKPREEMLKTLAKLGEIKELGLMVYTQAGFQEFLQTPLPVFENRTACDLIYLGEYDRVIGSLAADFEGAGF